MIIDSHQHFWDLEQPFDYEWLNAPQLASINKSFLPADLKINLDQVGVHKSIFVQTQHRLDENSWVLDLAEKNDFIAGVVGWVDLQSEQCEQQVLKLKQHWFKQISSLVSTRL